MKALQYRKAGGLEVLEVSQTQNPEGPKDNEILVEVVAASINPIDYKVREGYIPGVPANFPAIIGGDFSGIVKEIGGNVNDFNVNDEVFGQAGILNGGTGSMAEFAIASVNKISIKPKNISFEEAASLPLAGVSALQAIEDHINISSGQKLLIHGGAGGIGSHAVQIAKAKNAYVTTTVATEDIDFAKKLGADEVIDYKNQKFEEILKDFDAVFDTAGSHVWEGSFKVLKKGGVFVAMNGQPDPETAEKLQITSIGQSTEVTPQRLNRLKELVEEGILTTQIDKIFSLDESIEAFRYQEEKSPKGKVVIKIKD